MFSNVKLRSFTFGAVHCGMSAINFIKTTQRHKTLTEQVRPVTCSEKRRGAKVALQPIARRRPRLQKHGDYFCDAVANSDLCEGAFGAEEFVGQTERDAQHGRERQTPADDFSPPGVHVRVVVRQRLVVDQMEQEDALQNSNICGEIPNGEALGHISSSRLRPTMHTHGVMKDQHHFIQGSGL